MFKRKESIMIETLMGKERIKIEVMSNFRTLEWVYFDIHLRHYRWSANKWGIRNSSKSNNDTEMINLCILQKLKLSLEQEKKKKGANLIFCFLTRI